VQSELQQRFVVPSVQLARALRGSMPLVRRGPRVFPVSLMDLPVGSGEQMSERFNGLGAKPGQPLVSLKRLLISNSAALGRPVYGARPGTEDPWDHGSQGTENHENPPWATSPHFQGISTSRWNSG
jgi:hypothetical protein